MRTRSSGSARPARRCSRCLTSRRPRHKGTTRNGGLMTAQDAGRPLDGVRVLDFGQYVAGPMAATLLADAGAAVTRIEPPGGPWFSDPGNAYLLRGRAATHVLDLKSAVGRSRALALVAEADVLIENFRPGAMARLGLAG